MPRSETGQVGYKQNHKKQAVTHTPNTRPVGGTPPPRRSGPAQGPDRRGARVPPTQCVPRMYVSSYPLGLGVLSRLRAGRPLRGVAEDLP